MIRNVVIVGGGSAGWMTAAAFERLLPEYNVTLIESPDVPVIGVGESTLGQINNYMHLIGLKDTDWMKECCATYKVGIRFTDFYRKDGTYWDYPFVNPSDDELPVGLKTMWWLENAYPDKYNHPNWFARAVNGNTWLMEYNKLDPTERFGKFDTDYSYHMDAVKFGQWLRKNVCYNVNHIKAHVEDASVTDKGIENIRLDTGDVISADLFVDCTGFQSLLLEQYLGVEHKSYNHILPNNKAIATRLPHVDVQNYTNGTGLDNGWVWNIPLWNRTGTGYVWCDKFTDKQSAEQEFRDHIEKTTGIKSGNYQLRHIDIKNGKHDKAWYKNVVAVGLSWGFLEPLESTGLLTTHEQIIRLIETLSTRDGVVSSIEKSMFNTAADRELDGFADFISWHYAFSMRRDTEYWRYVTEEIDYSHSHKDMNHPQDNIFANLAAHKYVAHDITDEMGGNLYVIFGNKFSLIKGPSAGKLTKKYGEPPIEEWMEEVDNQMKDAVQFVHGLPTSEEYLRQTIYAEA
jgi:flavin-dependent dehydrogenase